MTRFFKQMMIGLVTFLFMGTAHSRAETKKYPDLVAVKDGSPTQMFEAGIRELGGMEQFVKKGQTVLVKPNIGWDKTPTQGADTNPELVGAIVRAAYTAGAKKVVVFDHTCDEPRACYRNSGIEKAVTDNKGISYPGNDEKDYIEVTIPNAKTLKKVKVHRIFMESDVIINVPILKHHMGSLMTAAMKNLMGVVWDRRFWHRNDLNQCIAEFGLLPKKPNLTVIDAYLVMTDNGPRGLSPDNLKLMKMQILSKDMVLADAAAAKTLGVAPSEVRYLATAQSLGVGSANLEKAVIKRITLSTPK